MQEPWKYTHLSDPAASEEGGQSGAGTVKVTEVIVQRKEQNLPCTTVFPQPS